MGDVSAPCHSFDSFRSSRAQCLSGAVPFTQHGTLRKPKLMRLCSLKRVWSSSMHGAGKRGTLARPLQTALSVKRSSDRHDGCMCYATRV